MTYTAAAGDPANNHTDVSGGNVPAQNKDFLFFNNRGVGTYEFQIPENAESSQAPGGEEPLQLAVMTPETQVEGLPYWQTRPCPTWCMGMHGPHESITDAQHFSKFDVTMLLRTQEVQPAVVNGEVHVDPVQLMVSLRQHELEAAPRVALVADVDGQERELKLTLPEARELAAGIDRLLALAEKEGHR